MARASRRSWLKSLSILSVIFLGAVLFLRHHWATQDELHARFYETGKSINDFLSSYCDAVIEAQTQNNPTPLMGLYSQSYQVPDRGHFLWGKPEILGEVLRSQRITHGHTDYTRAQLTDEIEAELATFASIDKTVCKIDLIEQASPGIEARLTVKFIVDSVDREGRSVQDRQFFRWHLINEAGPNERTRWRIQHDELVDGVRVAGHRTTQADIDPRLLGIDFQHRRDPRLHMKTFRSDLRFGVAQHSSGGLVAADYNGDGRTDLLFLDGRQSRLYRHDGLVEDLPQFTDVTLEEGLQDLGSAHSALLVDFDNDGDRDLFVARYLAPNRYYRNRGTGRDGPRFEEVGASMGLDAILPCSSATVLDFDRDGFLDLYVGAFGNAFEDIPRLPFYATNGAANRLYRNDRGRGFIDVTEATGTGDTGWTLAVAAADVDGDGWTDLAVANDFGRKTLFRNNGPRADGTVTFSDVAKQAGVLDFSGGMGLTFGDVDDDGLIDLYTSNINSNQRWYGEDVTVGQYVRNVLRSRWFLRDLGEYFKLYGLLGFDWVQLGKQVGEGNSLFKNRGLGADGTVVFKEARDSRAERVGWGWGVALFDADNDSDLDLYAANGWISNTPGTDL